MTLAFGNLYNETPPFILSPPRPQLLTSCACDFAGLLDSEWWTEPRVAGARSQALRSNHSDLQTQQWVCCAVCCWPECVVFFGLVTVVTLVTLIIENINEAEVTTFKMSFWSNLLKVIFFHLVIKIKAEGSHLVKIGHPPFIWLSRCQWCILP